MKTKILLLLVLLCTTIFSSCKKDEELSNPKYTEAQISVFKVFNGRFYTNIEVLSKRWETITFKENFNTPKTYKYSLLYDEKMDVEVHGLLDYYYDEDKETVYKCAYKISRDGKIFTIYTLNDSNEIYTSTKNKITIVDNSQFKLYSEYGDSYIPTASIYYREN